MAMIFNRCGRKARSLPSDRLAGQANWEGGVTSGFFLFFLRKVKGRKNGNIPAPPCGGTDPQFDDLSILRNAATILELKGDLSTRIGLDVSRRAPLSVLDYLSVSMGVFEAAVTDAKAVDAYQAERLRARASQVAAFGPPPLKVGPAPNMIGF